MHCKVFITDKINEISPLWISPYFASNFQHLPSPLVPQPTSRLEQQYGNHFKIEQNIASVHVSNGLILKKKIQKLSVTFRISMLDLRSLFYLLPIYFYLLLLCIDQRKAVKVDLWLFDIHLYLEVELTS